VSMDRLEIDAAYAVRFPQLSAGPHARIIVRDTGHGMDASTLERIFEPFFTTKGVGEGTGLGLSVVHGVIAKHQGAIQVESTVGVGTIFTILLPLAGVHKKAFEHHSDQIPHGTERILFVDDEEEIVRMGERILANLGYRVSGRTSSVEALQAFRADPRRFDLVITDQNMPHMTGTDLARELHHERKDIPVILTTGFSETITDENIHSLGIAALIIKPFVIVETAQTIRRVMDHQTAFPFRASDSSA
jgi:two-component system cell cycle sensor histidine kinase/response regulator CckA